MFIWTWESLKMSLKPCEPNKMMSLRLWVEEVGQLKAVCGQWLWWEVQGLTWSWSWNGWKQKQSFVTRFSISKKKKKIE